MDFRLTDQQELLVATARDFLARRCPPDVVQALAHDDRGFSEDLWKEASALGWPGLLIPARLGGSDGSWLDVVVLLEEMGRVCFPSPYIQSAVVATSLILAAGTRAEHERLLPPMALGDRLCAVALVEESAAFEPEALTLRGDVGSTLSGRKLFVKDAHVAHDLIVVARGGGGFNLLLLATDRPGVDLLPMETISGEKLFEVVFSDVEVRREDLLGPPGRGWEALVPSLAAGALARSAEMVGCAQRILDLAVDYAKVRVQLGRPIGSFQAIQHYCADLVRSVEAARYLVYHAAWKMEAGFPSTAEVAMAKAYAGDACLAVARTGHQILGAIGYCEEHPLHLFHKRIQAARLDFGDPGLHLETVAQAIGLA
ncbi:MAG: acyl-CoA/acyl-ACP dehydrogenase [Candidatus Rokubacteria bacterium]|nr:acyl-CoA/acyl-ACP dehydrogenase [Candidatus Rokubacteria bacterium]